MARNYRREYARRIASGLSRGLTRPQARGHPSPGQAPARQARRGQVDVAGRRELRGWMQSSDLEQRRAVGEISGLSWEWRRIAVAGVGQFYGPKQMMQLIRDADVGGRTPALDYKTRQARFALMQVIRKSYLAGQEEFRYEALF